MFEHLVTPSGTKVAHSVSDLAEFARVPAAVVTPMLASSAGSESCARSTRSRREADRYEIFHDVLADAILGWRRRRVVEQERVVSRRRQRRLAAVALAALAVAAAMLAIALYALSARSDARHQAAIALAADKKLHKTNKRLRVAIVGAEHQKKIANQEKAEAETEKQKADASAATAKTEQQKADASAATAKTEQQKADASAATAKTEQQKADASAAAAETAKAQAQTSANAYLRERDEARTQRYNAHRAELKAEHEAQVALAGEHAFHALALLGTDPQRSLALAVQAAKSDRSPLVERALRDGLLAAHELGLVPVGAPAQAMAVSADESRAAVSTTGDTATVMDLTAGRKLATLDAGAPLKSVAISPDGSTIATGDKSGHVILWAAGGNRRRTLATNRKRLQTLAAKGAVNALTFSPDGRTIAASGQDRIIMLWNASSGAPLRPLRAGFVVRSLVFSPAGDRLLALGRTKAIQVFDVASGKLDYTLTQTGLRRRRRSRPTDRRSSPAARTRAARTCCPPKTDRPSTSWRRPRTSTQSHFRPTARTSPRRAGTRRPVSGTPRPANSRRFWSAMGRPSSVSLSARTASTSSPRAPTWTAGVWQATDGYAREVLAGDGAGVVAARFLRGATRAVTAGADGTVRFWNTNFDPPMRTLGVHHGGATGGRVRRTRDGRERRRGRVRSLLEHRAPAADSDDQRRRSAHGRGGDERRRDDCGVGGGRPHLCMARERRGGHDAVRPGLAPVSGVVD